MKKKYTMEEFEKMYDESVKEALKELSAKMNEAQKNEKEKDFMFDMIFSMQNMAAMTELKRILFKKEF